MSQLYQLFCEGLKTRSDKEGLSSTVLVTSTPLEDETEEDAGFVAQPVRGDISQFKDAVKEKESPNFSLQGQVGSATPEKTPEMAPSPANASLQRPEPVVCLQSVDSSLNRSSRHLKERNKNVSPVDFVDRVIAVKRRDEALGQNFVCNTKRPTPSDTRQSSEQNVPCRKRVSDSSETDFEGADEYFKKNPTPSSLAVSKAHETKISAKRPRSSVESRRSASDESMNLVLDRVSTTDSSSNISLESEGLEVDETRSTAARCRIFHKICQTPEGFTQPAPPENDQLNSRVTGTQAPISEGNSQSKHGTISAVNGLKKNLTILKGVTGYVEVRSGHDNRSMGVRTRLRALGATVVEKFTKEVTHVVFNEGAPSTLKRAQKHGCHLVSVLWIDDCEKLRCIAPENEHPPLNMHLYEEPHAFSKYRKKKSFQPDFEEGKSEERLKNYVKKFRRKAQQAVSSQKTPENSSSESNEDSDTRERNGEPSEHLLPGGYVVKRLSVVLHRIDADNASVSSDRRNKRRLMPFRQELPSSLSLEEFDPSERLRPECPYNKETASTQKSVSTQKRIRASISLRRRSSCFVRGTQGSARSQGTARSQYCQKKARPQMRTMVCTFMHRRDIDVVAAVIKQLGGWILEPTVSSKTTHVVCGDSKRTINLLKGIANGCWILHQEWVMRSLEAGYWLDEEPFELSIFPAIQQCRVARETLGVSPNIFRAAGAIYVAKDTTPPRSDLLNLLQLCGAHTVTAARQAKVIVGQYQRRASHSDAAQVNEQWVLDSIQENMLQPLQLYRVK